MAASRKPLPNSLLDSVAAWLTQHVAHGSRVAVGLSGGVDSVVLLDLLAQLAASHPIQLSAIHINHRISPHADAWAGACAQLCSERDIPLKIHTICLDGVAQLGLEAAARKARYAAFTQHDCDAIALAHHRDDQAETLLLQLLRGAGAKGLAAMPALRHPACGPALLRPLLEHDRSEIEAWARARQLDWVEDESNADTHHARNFLRHAVLPLLATRYPAWRTTLSRSAKNMAEAAELLDEMAATDATDAMLPRRLNCARLAELSPTRARNLLRYFLSQHSVPGASRERLAAMLTQLTAARNDAEILLEHAHWQLRRYRGWAYLVPMPTPISAGQRWHWRDLAPLTLPELGGTLQLIERLGSGLATAKLAGANLNLRVRQGGETLRPNCQRPRRSLKNLLQESALPPWQRDRLPLLFCNDTLVWVPGIGIDCDWQAAADSPGLEPQWLSDNDA
jgi:tRNA(Ile)-lysidine synthase